MDDEDGTTPESEEKKLYNSAAPHSSLIRRQEYCPHVCQLLNTTVKKTHQQVKDLLRTTTSFGGLME
jgi:hypothetical protein